MSGGFGLVVAMSVVYFQLLVKVEFGEVSDSRCAGFHHLQKNIHRPHRLAYYDVDKLSGSVNQSCQACLVRIATHLASLASPASPLHPLQHHLQHLLPPSTTNPPPQSPP